MEPPHLPPPGGLRRQRGGAKVQTWWSGTRGAGRRSLEDSSQEFLANALWSMSLRGEARAPLGDHTEAAPGWFFQEVGASRAPA